MTISAPVVLVTGASAGVGLALSRILAKTTYRLVLTAREKSLSRFGDAGLHVNPQLLIYPLDITDHHQRLHVIADINHRWGGVDVLVNNAGISYRAVVEEMSHKEELHQLNTNYLAAMALIRLVLPTMRAKRSGKIINVSSVGGMMAMPTMSAYSASKFALEGASEALWYEMRPWDISVSLIEPGFIHSPSFEHVYYTKKSGVSGIFHNGPYCHYYENMEPFIAQMMNLSRQTADDVARTIFKTIQKKNPPLRVPATLDASIFYGLRRLLPRWFYHKLLFRCLPGIKNWVEKPLAPLDTPRQIT